MLERLADTALVSTPIDPEFGLAELEARLYQHLGIPVPFRAPQAPAPPAEAQQDDTAKAVRRLQHELFQLRQDAGRIGKIPLRYPRHIAIVMKVISALLPWYTRPIVDFSQRTSRTAEAMANLLDHLLREQESLGRQLAELRNTAPHTPAGGSGNNNGTGPSASA